MYIFSSFFFGYINQPAKKENINEWILCIWYFVLQICVYGLFSSKMFSFDAAKLLVCFEKIRLKTFSIHIAHATEHIFYDFTTFQDILFIFFDSVRVVVVLFWQKSYEGKYLLNHLLFGGTFLRPLLWWLSYGFLWLPAIVLESLLTYLFQNERNNGLPSAHESKQFTIVKLAISQAHWKRKN